MPPFIMKGGIAVDEEPHWQVGIAVYSNSHFGKLRALSALTGTGSGSKTVAPGDRFAP
jgi:hypothetical protein